MAIETVTIPVRNREAVIAGIENATEMTVIQAMATRMWRVLVPMGFMIIVISFILGIINGINLGDFFGDAKIVREANPNHENFGTVQAIVLIAISCSPLSSGLKPCTAPPSIRGAAVSESAALVAVPLFKNGGADWVSPAR